MRLRTPIARLPVTCMKALATAWCGRRSRSPRKSVSDSARTDRQAILDLHANAKSQDVPIHDPRHLVGLRGLLDHQVRRGERLEWPEITHEDLADAIAGPLRFMSDDIDLVGAESRRSGRRASEGRIRDGELGKRTSSSAREAADIKGRACSAGTPSREHIIKRSTCRRGPVGR